MDPTKFYKCLADETRLKTLLIISQVNEVCVCHLTEALQLEQPKISRHLAELRKCHILQDERRGKWVYYKLHPDLPLWASNVILDTAKSNAAYFGGALTTVQSSTIRSC